MKKAVLLAAAAGLLAVGTFAVAETTPAKPAAPAAAVAAGKDAAPGHHKNKPMREMTLEEARATSKERLEKVQKRHDELMKMTPAQWEEKKKELAAKHRARQAGQQATGKK